MLIFLVATQHICTCLSLHNCIPWPGICVRTVSEDCQDSTEGVKRLPWCPLVAKITSLYTQYWLLSAEFLEIGFNSYKYFACNTFEVMYVDVKLRKFFGQNSNLFKVNVHGTENRILDLLLYVCWEKYEEFPTIIKLVIWCSYGLKIFIMGGIRWGNLIPKHDQ